MRMVFWSNQPWNLIKRNNSQKDRNYRDDGDCFPTEKKKQGLKPHPSTIKDVLCQSKAWKSNSCGKICGRTLNWPQVDCMNLISDTGDLMSLDWVFGDIQEQKGAIPLQRCQTKAPDFRVTGNSTFHCWMEIMMVCLLEEIPAVSDCSSLGLFLRSIFPRAIFDFKRVTFTFLALLTDHFLKLYWFFCYLLQVCKILIRAASCWKLQTTTTVVCQHCCIQLMRIRL